MAMEVEANSNSSPPGASNETNDVIDESLSSLCIPIASSSDKEFIEIFPDEINSVPSSQLSTILQDEKAPLKLWTDAALLYMSQKKERDSTTILSTACDELISKQNLGNKNERTRTLAAAGIAYLTQANKSASTSTTGSSGVVDIDVHDNTQRQREASQYNSELRELADKHFNRASKLDQLYPMTWIGKGMLNLSLQRNDRAKFFFQTTLDQCGQVLPAILGMASVHFKEGNYRDCLEMYLKAIKLFPSKSGASARVGLGLACYKLGQVDRAKAAFKRAYEMDPENVEAMVGISVLDISSLDEALTRTDKEYKKVADNAMRLISMANLIDHSNAMVQNHLANYYFHKWTPITGVTVKVEKNSNVVIGSGPINLDPGERVKIGYSFETTILDTEDEDDDDDMLDENNNSFKIKDAWTGDSAEGLKVWKKDYDRVITLARGAYSSTSVQSIQAESLFILARVHHVRDDIEKANSFYDRACKLAPELTPARFGLAQTYLWDERYQDAEGNLELVVRKSPAATDAQAILGLLKVKSGQNKKEGFSYIKKAIDLDPANADLVLLEALALQQQESDYSSALQRYQTAVDLMESQGESPSWIILSNMGVLCHETKKYDEASKCYEKALQALQRSEGVDIGASLEKEEDLIHHDDNKFFWEYITTNIDCSFQQNDNWTLSDLCPDLKVGDHISIGEDFTTEVAELKGKEMKVKENFVLHDTSNGQESSTKKLPLRVKRSNSRLSLPSAISIAFNLARLHEASGRTIAAVELHKAIIKRHPSYVNSYLRLACISRDCGSLANCSEWLKSACQVAPGNPEVLTLVGNLHLSLCDWKPAQNVFNQLLEQKIPNVEAYSMLCLGNIYFNNLKTPGRYSKHLKYAGDFYRRILNKDHANAFAANGLGTIMAEKADLLRAKETFNNVREISGDSIPDALLNLGHIYLALSKHPEALQMYQNYLERTNQSDTPTSSKSRHEDEAEILLYIAFAYFDWARQTEVCNNAKAAPADERYQKSASYIEMAIKKTKRENVILRYDLCTTKLALAECVLNKFSRGIRRTAKEIQDALDGLQESLPKVQTMLQWKQEGKKVAVSTTLLTQFVEECKKTIEKAKNHLTQELTKEEEAAMAREKQKLEALEKQKQRELEMIEAQEQAARDQEEVEKKAREKMEKLSSLQERWEQETEKAKEVKKQKKGKSVENPQAEDGDDGEVDPNKSLFDDSSDEEDNVNDNDVISGDLEEVSKKETGQSEKDLFGDSSDDEGDDGDKETTKEPESAHVQSQELFGEDSSSDEELVPTTKRGSSAVENPSNNAEAPPKKRRIEED